MECSKTVYYCPDCHLIHVGKKECICGFITIAINEDDYVEVQIGKMIGICNPDSIRAVLSILNVEYVPRMYFKNKK